MSKPKSTEDISEDIANTLEFNKFVYLSPK